MEGLLTDVMFEIPERGPTAAAQAHVMAVLLDEEGVLSNSGARIVAEHEMQAAVAADASGQAGSGGSFDGAAEPIAAEVQ